MATFDRTNPLAGSVGTAIGAFVIESEFKDAYVQQWNMTVERSFGANLLSIGYVGNKGTHLITFAPPNLAPPGPGDINPRRPYTNVGGIHMYEASRDSNYHGLQLKAQRRFSRGLSFVVSYAFAKSINTGDGTYIESNSDSFQQPRCASCERGLAEFDVRHALTFGYVYEFPFGKGATGVGAKIISGWQLVGLTRLLTGSPLRISNGYDNLNNGGTGYPDRICDPNISGSRTNAQKIEEWFDTSCFVAAGGGTVGVPNFTFGNAGRQNVIGPGTQLWDIGLQKDIPFTERVSLRFKVEFFNAFNNVNFLGAPGRFSGVATGTAFGEPQFGKIRTTAEFSREIQFGLQITF